MKDFLNRQIRAFRRWRLEAVTENLKRWKVLRNGISDAAERRDTDKMMAEIVRKKQSLEKKLGIAS